MGSCVLVYMEQPQATRLKRAAPLSPPEKPKEDECCELDCPNCVLLVYQVQLVHHAHKYEYTIFFLTTICYYT